MSSIKAPYKKSEVITHQTAFRYYGKNIIIPEGIKAIGSETFQQQRRLQRLTLPSTLQQIGSRAFFNALL